MSADGMRPKDDPARDAERAGGEESDDDLDALSSELGASAETSDVDDDLDLANLAAVASAPAAAQGGETEDESRVDLSSVAPGALERAPAAAPSVVGDDEHDLHIPGVSRKPWLVPVWVLAALGLGVGGYALGRSSSVQPVAPTVVQSPGLPSESPRVGVSAAPQAPASTAPQAPAAQPVAAAVPTPTPTLPAQGVVADQAGETEHAVPPVVQDRARADLAPVVASAQASAPPAPRAAAPLTTRSAPSSLAGAVSVAEPKLVVVPKTEPVATAPTPEAAKASTPELEPAAAPTRSVDALLDDAFANPRDRAAEPTAEAGLPEAPTREQVTEAMSVIAPAIRGCAMGQTGLATAAIVVRGDGRVASVEVAGAPFSGTASGRCMEGVIRRARFSRFRQPTFRVRFPFAIQ